MLSGAGSSAPFPEKRSNCSLDVDCIQEQTYLLPRGLKGGAEVLGLLRKTPVLTPSPQSV